MIDEESLSLGCSTRSVGHILYCQISINVFIPRLMCLCPDNLMSSSGKFLADRHKNVVVLRQVPDKIDLHYNKALMLSIIDFSSELVFGSFFKKDSWISSLMFVRAY